MSACSSRSGSRPRITRAFSTDPSVPTIACTTTCALDFRAHRRRRVLGLHHPNRPRHPHAGRALRDGVLREIVIRHQARRDPAVPAEAGGARWRRHLSARGRRRWCGRNRWHLHVTAVVAVAVMRAARQPGRLTAAPVAPEEPVARAVSAAQGGTPWTSMPPAVRTGLPATAAQRARLSAEGGAGTDADTGTGRTIDATVTSNTAATATECGNRFGQRHGTTPFPLENTQHTAFGVHRRAPWPWTR